MYTNCDLILSVKEAENREKWLAVRNQGIGGSDASVIMGLNPYKSAYQLSVSYTHLTLPTILRSCRSRWSPYH